MKLLRILLASGAMLLVGGSAAAAQDSAYPPRLIAVTLSDSSVQTGAPYTVTVDGCEIGQDVNFTLDGLSVEALCIEPAREQTALVLTSVPGRATAELTAPNRAGDFVGVARIGFGDDSIDLNYALEVTEAGAAFVSASAVGPPAGADSSFSSAVKVVLPFVLGIGLASGFSAVGNGATDLVRRVRVGGRRGVS